MNPADAAELLSLAAAFDRRKIGKADALAWADALDDLDVRDCAEAVRAHFRESTDYLMPAHVRAAVRQIRAKRIAAANTGLLEPDNVDPNDVSAYLAAGRVRRRVLASGGTIVPTPVESVDRTTALAALIESTDKRLPRMPPAFPVTGRRAAS